MNASFFEKFFLSHPSALISLVLVFAFLFLSNFGAFIPVQNQQALSFNLFERPQNFFLYLFAHSGVAHLVANVFLVFFLGWVVEGVVPKKHVYGLFFGVGAMSFALFNLASPGTFGVGAIGGSIALTAAAFVLSPKKSIIALLSVLFLSLLLMGGYNIIQGIEKQNLQAAQSKAMADLQLAVESKNAPLSAAKLKEVQAVSAAIKEKELQAQYSKNISVANAVHLIAAVLAIVYLFLFCRGQAERSMKELLGFIQGKHLKPF